MQIAICNGSSWYWSLPIQERVSFGWERHMAGGTFEMLGWVNCEWMALVQIKFRCFIAGTGTMWFRGGRSWWGSKSHFFIHWRSEFYWLIYVLIFMMLNKNNSDNLLNIDSFCLLINMRTFIKVFFLLFLMNEKRNCRRAMLNFPPNIYCFYDDRPTF